MPRSKQTLGVVYLVPLLIVAFVLVGIAGSVITSKQNVNSSVLSENSGSGSSGSGSSESNDSDDDDNRGDTNNTSGSSSSDSDGGSPASTPGATSTPKPLLFRLFTRQTPESDDLDEDNDDIDEGEVEDDEEGFENEIQDDLDLGRQVEVENKEGRVKVKVRIGNITRETEVREGETRVRFKIEENGIENSVTLRIRGDSFIVTHEGVEATTLFPLTIDPVTNTLVINAPGGPINVVTLPGTAVENILATGKVDDVEETEIEEGGNGAVFRIRGANNLRLLGIFPVTIPVESLVDVSTGQIIEVQEPTLVRIFRFLFAE